MKQLRLSLAVLLALAAWGGAAPSVGAQSRGKITGIVSGPSGPIGGLTVNIVNNAGAVVGTAVTAQNGAYTVENLAVGNYTIQVVSASGSVVSTGVGAVSATSLTTTVNLSLTASQLASVAGAAGGGGVLGLTTATKVVLATAAAAGTGVLLFAATRSDSSPTR